jgi:hypothetical protein
VRISAALAVLAMAAFLVACGSGTEPEKRAVSIAVPPEDVAGEISWSPDNRCAAVVLSNKDGHSPMTTTRVVVVEPGIDAYREIRLPQPNERFSTVFDRWEAPGVLRLHATTLESEISARYSCTSRKLEIIP